MCPALEWIGVMSWTDNDDSCSSICFGMNAYWSSFDQTVVGMLIDEAFIDLIEDVVIASQVSCDEWAINCVTLTCATECNNLAHDELKSNLWKLSVSNHGIHTVFWSQNSFEDSEWHLHSTQWNECNANPQS